VSGGQSWLQEKYRQFIYEGIVFQLFISHTIPANDIILLAFLSAGNNYRNFGQVQNLPGQTLTTAHEEKQ
jgi:hypothetical protein